MPSILHLRAAWGKGGGLPLCCLGGAHEEANYIPDEGRLAAKPTGDPSFGIIARKALGKVRSITTDNGCEFLDPKKIKAVVGCDVYYTRAYASWEKGSVENCNRFVRRWYPKGTDFGKCTTADMHRLERVINSIHRKLLDGLTAYEYDTAYARAA